MRLTRYTDYALRVVIYLAVLLGVRLRRIYHPLHGLLHRLRPARRPPAMRVHPLLLVGHTVIPISRMASDTSAPS